MIQMVKIAYFERCTSGTSIYMPRYIYITKQRFYLFEVSPKKLKQMSR